MKQMFVRLYSGVGAIAVVMSLAGGVNAQPISDTVFGLELNALPSIPECSIKRGKEKEFDRYDRPSQGACYGREAKGKQSLFGAVAVYAEGPLGDERLGIKFAEGQEPANFGRIYADTRSGKIDVVGAVTGGIPTQAQDLAGLTEKFGKPTHQEAIHLQNKMGAQYEGLIAEWELPSGTYVRLERPGNLRTPGDMGINLGFLRVQSATFRAENKARRQTEASKRVGL